MIQPEDEISGSEDIINLDDVKARINYLVEHDCHQPERSNFPCENTYNCGTCTEEAEEELTALRNLSDEMEDFGEKPSAIRDNYMETFVQNEADDVANINQGSYLFGYIDWGQLTRDKELDMSETTYRGSTYFITS